MLTLLIETCTERAIVAIIKDEHCCYMAGLPYGLHNSRFLVPKVEEGLQCVGKKPQDLDLVAVGVGPGSYTGIRAGTIVAKSLSYSCKVPLVGVCTLEGFIPDCDGSFAAILDAKMAGSYILKGNRSKGVITYLSEPTVCPLEDLQEQLEEVDILVSPHCLTLQEKIEELYPGAKWSWQETAPDPIHMARRAEEKWAEGKYSLDGSLEILYLRD